MVKRNNCKSCFSRILGQTQAWKNDSYGKGIDINDGDACMLHIYV
jgi:hypothetical protein